ncbi:MAG: class III poly(R)-hydroxyalkanoic acid synthase subunit PhaC [Dehalococcoidia bacterium]|nr:Poly(3-hydroxyalkanoate) polymerase subunit PhaC [Chloroflexota bacterium]MBT9162277.1 Poly(3-hydroxyalkanoate) polymerase subunit PhaC [Chloroflexota bacterium]
MRNPFVENTEQLMKEMTEANRKLLKLSDILMNLSDTDVGTTPKDLVYEEDRMRLFHYKPMMKTPCPVPMLVTYALVNRQYMLDLQQDRSLIRNLLSLGLDIYIIDWGYPGPADRYLTLDDYINGYMNRAVDIVRERSKLDKINLVGVCQGGTFSVIYAALYPEKLRNLVVMVTPVDFDTDDGLLHVWARDLPIDNMVDTLGVIPGDLMNVGFVMLKPFQLMVDKYVGLMENCDEKEVVENFVRMEKWIFDSPGQAGEAIRQFVNDLYKNNLLIKNKLKIGGQTVDLRRINMPLLNIFAEQDHLVPPSASKPLNDAVSSEDKSFFSLRGGHIGIYVSSQSQTELAPAVAEWITTRSQLPKKAVSGRNKKSESAKNQAT